jgi:hypothetical protein
VSDTSVPSGQGCAGVKMRVDPCQAVVPGTGGFTLSACCTEPWSIGCENAIWTGSVGATSPSGWPALHCTVGAGTGVGPAALPLAAEDVVWLLEAGAALDWLPAGAVEACPLLTVPVAGDAGAGAAVAAWPTACGPKVQLLSSVTKRSSEQSSEERRCGRVTCAFLCPVVGDCQMRTAR